MIIPDEDRILLFLETRMLESNTPYMNTELISVSWLY